MTAHLNRPEKGLAMDATLDATRTCKSCGTPILRQTNWSHSYYASRLYCNKSCRDADRPDINSDYVVSQTGCWEWQGHIDRNGYGKGYDRDRPLGMRVDWAHRISWRQLRGSIPAGMELDHMCENTVCINPDHLQIVTRAEHADITMRRPGKDDLQTEAVQLRALNLTYAEIADALQLAGKESAYYAVQAAVTKGLVNADNIPPVQRLTDADRADIRALYKLGVPQTEISTWYEMDSSQISRICSGLRSKCRHRRAVA